MISARNGLLLKKIEFENFGLVTDQIMSVDSTLWQMIKLRRTQFARGFSLGEIYRQSRSVR
ncbi:hypothetical protein B9N66_00265 [Campylobacter concisus]|uniref:hypothetical protein n=1 Tax=Campylobacter concisus TaxID=199 RepID=UPI000B3D5427|nr:hypothetical protein [Campylobacter concisus]OUT10494.1 hypothetical protein B9N66_00265 [Campylobacter concisus]